MLKAEAEKSKNDRKVAAIEGKVKEQIKRANAGKDVIEVDSELASSSEGEDDDEYDDEEGEDSYGDEEGEDDDQDEDDEDGEGNEYGSEDEEESD